MPTASCTIHVSGREPIPATLSTERAESSHGVPVLVMAGGVSYPEGQSVAFGPGDVTSLGLAAALLIEVEPEPAHERLLERWQRACIALLARVGVQMATDWLLAGGWTDGSTWTQKTDEGKTRSLVDELDAAPLEREAVRHVVANEDVPDVEGASWTFPDGSGVVEIGAVWDTFDRNGRTTAGRIVRGERP